MRHIEAGNRPAAGWSAQRDLARTVAGLSGTARRRLPSVTAARALAVQWEPPLPWELTSVSFGSCHAGYPGCSKTAHELEPRYGIEP